MGLKITRGRDLQTFYFLQRRFLGYYAPRVRVQNFPVKIFPTLKNFLQQFFWVAIDPYC